MSLQKSHKYESGAWRFDADFYKNDSLSQPSTYGGGVLTGSYNAVNNGNVRLAYTLNKGGSKYATLSLAGKGGQVYVSSTGHGYGNQWATTAAMNGHWGPWTLQLQAVDYAYNIPKNKGLPRGTVTAEDFGFAYPMPAKGQVYDVNLARSFKVHWGPISQVQLYDNYSYLNVGGNGKFDTTNNPTGNVQLNAAGAMFVAGPIYLWADLVSGKNSAMAFVGPNNGRWHTLFALTAAFYFSGKFSK